MNYDEIPPLTAQAANLALGLPADTVGIWIEHRLNTARRRWEVRRLDEGGTPTTAWTPVGFTEYDRRYRIEHREFDPPASTVDAWRR